MIYDAPVDRTSMPIASDGDSLTLLIEAPTYEDVLDAHLSPENLGERYRKAIDRVRGWEDVVDISGIPIPFSPVGLLELFAAKPELFRAFHTAMEDRLFGKVAQTAKKPPTAPDPSAEAAEPTT